MRRDFESESNETDRGKVNYGAVCLGGNPAEVWPAYKDNSPDWKTLTWVGFKAIIFAELGDVQKLHQLATKEWYHAEQEEDENVQAYSARLDQLTQEISRRLSDAERAEKFRTGLRPRITARMKEQATQVTTHRELVAQAQRIEGNQLGE